MTEFFRKNEIPTNGDSVTAEEKKNDSLPLSKLPRKKFPWTEEMRYTYFFYFIKYN